MARDARVGPTQRPRVLIVENDPLSRSACAALLVDRFEVSTSATAEAALEKVKHFLPDVVLLDARLPGASGLSVLPRVHEIVPEAVVLVTSAQSSIDAAIEAVRAGASAFLAKPFGLDVLEATIDRELARNHVALEAKHRREDALGRAVGDDDLWGDSPEMQAVLHGALDVAASRATVLITGESGTGKEVLARFLHKHSGCAKGPFVAVNCGAIPETLLESEFFGYEKGAFTGAAKQNLGKFERANGGTIFLDEIGDLSSALQVKILRVLQERQIDRVGGSRAIDIDVRVIAATNRNLEAMRSEGRFREDLYYRLNVIAIDMPPLRSRRGDIPLLWSRFLERYAAREGLPVPRTAAATLEALHVHDWPGNVRELENAAERAVILSHGGEILPGHLPPALAGRAHGAMPACAIPGASLDAIEKRAILETLASVDGCTSRAAEILGISVRKIQYRLSRWRSEAEAFDESPSRETHDEGRDEAHLGRFAVHEGGRATTRRYGPAAK